MTNRTWYNSPAERHHRSPAACHHLHFVTAAVPAARKLPFREALPVPEQCPRPAGCWQAPLPAQPRFRPQEQPARLPDAIKRLTPARGGESSEERGQETGGTQPREAARSGPSSAGAPAVPPAAPEAPGAEGSEQPTGSRGRAGPGERPRVPAPEAGPGRGGACAGPGGPGPGPAEGGLPAACPAALPPSLAAGLAPGPAAPPRPGASRPAPSRPRRRARVAVEPRAWRGDPARRHPPLSRPRRSPRPPGAPSPSSAPRGGGGTGEAAAARAPAQAAGSGIHGAPPGSAAGEEGEGGRAAAPGEELEPEPEPGPEPGPAAPPLGALRERARPRRGPLAGPSPAGLLPGTAAPRRQQRQPGPRGAARRLPALGRGPQARLAFPCRAGIVWFPTTTSFLFHSCRTFASVPFFFSLISLTS